MIMTAAAALVLGGVAGDLREARRWQCDAIDSGAARIEVEALDRSDERMSFLSEIVERKRQRVEEAKRRVPLEALERRSHSHRFREALLRDGVNIIAEFKRRSPSKGVIRADAM